MQRQLCTFACLICWSLSLRVFPSRTNLKLHNVSLTQKMVKKVIINLDLSETSGPDCIPVVVLKNCRPELSYILAEIFNKCLKKNIWGLHSNFVNCKSFLESSSPDILALCETNLDGSIDSGNFSVRDDSSHMHGLKRTSCCTGLISKKLCRFLLMFLTGFTSLSVFLLFPLQALASCVGDSLHLCCHSRKSRKRRLGWVMKSPS